jgi:hypothetical protein
MIDERWNGKHVEGSGPDMFKVLSRHLPGKTEKTTTTLSQGSRSLDRDLNPGLLEYEARALKR